MHPVMCMELGNMVILGGDVRGYREGMAMETQTEPQNQVPQPKAEPVNPLNPLQLPECVLLPTFAVS